MLLYAFEGHREGQSIAQWLREDVLNKDTLSEGRKENKCNCAGRASSEWSQATGLERLEIHLMLFSQNSVILLRCKP